MRIIFFGTPSFVIPVLKTLADSFKVVGVVTAPDAPQGRKQLITPSPVKQYAFEHIPDVPVITPQQFNHSAIEQLQSLTPDLFVVAAYGKIIPSSVLDIPKYGALNIHPSLLPKYRGPSPIQSALFDGVTESGTTIIKMDELMDHGPIVAQWTYPFQPADTFESLHQSMFKDAAGKLPEIITSYVDGKLTPTPQDESKATYCKRITRESGFADLENPPSKEKFDRMLRAYYPWPGVWTKINGKIVKFFPENKIQMEGKKPVTIKDFLNGYPEMKETISKLF